MTPEQKLHRAVTNFIYRNFEQAYREYHESEGYEGDYEDYLLAVIDTIEGLANKYHREKLKEKYTDYDLGEYGTVRIANAPHA
jgi:hypothetical protein